MWKVTNNLTIIIIAYFLLSCGSKTAETYDSAQADQLILENWAQDGIWDDGQAEVAKYDAERFIYGKKRSFEYVFVLVKEVFNEAYRVKTDDYGRKDLYEVMKVNKFCRIETQAYPYHYLTSVFFKKTSPARVHKLTNTSQEWCGNTAKSFLDDGRNYVFDFISYWDGQGNGQKEIKAGPWFEDQLSYTLRALRFRDGLSFQVPLYPMQINSYAEAPTVVAANIAVTKTARPSFTDTTSNLGTEAWKVDVSMENGLESSYWFGTEYPNYLLKMESSDGRKLRLKSVERDAYWSHE